MTKIGWKQKIFRVLYVIKKNILWLFSSSEIFWKYVIIFLLVMVYVLFFSSCRFQQNERNNGVIIKMKSHTSRHPPKRESTWNTPSKLLHEKPSLKKPKSNFTMSSQTKLNWPMKVNHVPVIVLVSWSHMWCNNHLMC